MNNTDRLSQDPSRKAGNRKRNAIRSVTAAAAIALAAACAPAPSEKPEPAPRTTIETTTTTKKPEVTTTTTTPEVQNVEALNAQMQTSAEGFATQIINEFNQGKSSENFIYERTNSPDKVVNVLYNSGTLVAGEFGEYNMSASVERDAQGNLDPSTVNRIHISEVVNVSGQEIAEQPSDRVSLYSFTLSKSEETGLWHGDVSIADKGSEQSSTITFGADKPIDLIGIISDVPMMPENYADLEGQASTVVGWAIEGAPVNIVPGISLKG